MSTHSKSPVHTTRSSTRAQLSRAGAALVLGLLAGLTFAAGETNPPPESAKREQLTIAQPEVMKPWTGDLDGMVERRFIRILTVYSKTFYFVDKGIQRGITYDIFHLFETDLNKKLAQSKQLKRKHIKVRVVFIPVHRGELLQALAAGKGDIAASNLSISEEREKLVDFSAPAYRNVSELL